MADKLQYKLVLGEADLDAVSQETYEALQNAITALVNESGAESFRIERGPEEIKSDEMTIRTLYVNDAVAP